MLRAIAYTRVSTDEQALYGYGLDAQEHAIRQYAARLQPPVQIMRIASDPGVSGTIYPRAGLEGALQQLERGDADMLIAHRVDRLGRRMWIPVMCYERLRASGRKLHSVEDNSEVNSSNLVMFALRCGMAEDDYTKIVKNMADGKRAAAAGGNQVARTVAPYGYRIITKITDGVLRKDAGSYEVIEAEAAIVRQMFQWAAEGASSVTIATRLDINHIPPPGATKSRSGRGSKRWHFGSVIRILRHTAYQGYTIYNRKARVNITGRAEFDPLTAEMVIQVPPIVTTELWEQAQAAMDYSAKYRRSNLSGDRRIFSGLIRCPYCKNICSSSLRERHGRKMARYICQYVHPPNTPAEQLCIGHPFYEEEILSALLHAFRAMQQNPEFLLAAAEAEEISRASQNAATAEEANAQLSSLRAQLASVAANEAAAAEALTEAISLGTPRAAFTDILRRLATSRADIEQQIRHAEQTAAVAGTTPRQRAISRLGWDPSTIAAQYIEEIVAVLTSPTITSAEKNQLLRMIIQQITPKRQPAPRLTRAVPTEYAIQFAPITEPDPAPLPQTPTTGPFPQSTKPSGVSFSRLEICVKLQPEKYAQRNRSIYCQRAVLDMFARVIQA